MNTSDVIERSRFKMLKFKDFWPSKLWENAERIHLAEMMMIIIIITDSYKCRNCQIVLSISSRILIFGNAESEKLKKINLA